MVEIGKSSDNPAVKKPAMTPKAIINQKFGDKARYKVEEVRDLTQTVCPGLAITQNAPCLYRCTLELPETVVISDACKRKKEAEQAAAEKAIEKLGIRQKEYNPTILEAWDDLARRLDTLFGNEFLSTLHPLSGHFRAALSRDGHFNGCVPISVIALLDARIANTCKYINPVAESNPLIMMSLVLIAAKQTKMVLSLNEHLSLRRRNPYPPEIIAFSSNSQSGLCSPISIEVIRIPASREKDVESLKLEITSTCYYLDVISQELDVEASKVLISRTIGKASSELRIYFSLPTPLLDFYNHLPELNIKLPPNFEEPLNERSSFLSGQAIYGDAILALVGYTWKSTELHHEDVSLRRYYRTLVNKTPNGAYKLSRQAILAANFPSAITTRSNWRGSFPREILCTLCRSHHLSEPVFVVECNASDSSQNLPGSCEMIEVQEKQKDEKSETAFSDRTGSLSGSTEVSSCKVKIYSKTQELLLHCSPRESYRKQIDAVQTTALKVLSFLSMFLETPDMSLENLDLIAKKFDIDYIPHCFFKEFALCQSIHKCGTTVMQACRIKNSCSGNYVVKNEPSYTNIGAQGITIGSLACINYTASLVTSEGECIKEHLESCEEFEFEMGNEAVLPNIETAVAQITVGQSACIQMDLLPHEFILATAVDSASIRSLLLSRCCQLEYNITLLRVTEPLEERMEQALFSPPLSKQRVEYAVQHIKESAAISLVDFGCGSGSLLDSLLQYPTSLEKIVGVDISKRSLARAAKSLHTKLESLLNPNGARSSSLIKSAVLFDGSITNFDSRLFDFDIATCLEVIEHMVEEDASLFGGVVLSSFRPKVLIVSTPNYEYNVLLQGSTPPSQEEDSDERNQTQSFKFRNYDHKFEWTRAQFNLWASDLATRHHYAVEFSGVGGSADIEPGFASQIAVFRRSDGGADDHVMVKEGSHQYTTIWEWNRENDVLMKKG